MGGYDSLHIESLRIRKFYYIAAMILSKLDESEDIAYVLYYGSEGGKKASKALNERRFRVGDANSRILNHWEQEGVIIDPRADGKGWRMYTAIELVWMQIVMDMREFNVPLALLRKVRENLMSNANGLKGCEYSTMPILELYVRQLTISKRSFELVFTADGAVDIGTSQQIHEFLKKDEAPNLIRIDLSKVVQKVAGHEIDDKRGKLTELSRAEADLVNDVRSGQYPEILLKTAKGKVKSVELKEVLPADNTMYDLKSDHKFQDVTFSVRHGRKTSVTRSISKKYK